ncbi:AraC family transcriptional regulator [Paenibacillus psychroresistens]|uniref:AraC family transcriptional regulator n=1 Tax=Paenibacillus psychroresistens TaxID=1778678 RepID=A0A6B8RFS9_9BACL|nr:AraC family transcriptional regulator [Paenibacillus psychroresistens]QGQ94584.1 AraC family transcriptional regulator [Paenibacillus psychroresistens]
MFQIDHSRAAYTLNSFANALNQQAIAFNIHYWGIEPFHLKNPMHKHSFYEICYVIDGQGVYSDDGIQYALDTGTLFCSRPEVWHQISSPKEMYLVYVAFEVDPQQSNKEMLERFNTLYRTQHFFLPHSENTVSALLWTALIKQFESPDLLVKENIVSIAQALLLSFYTAFTEQEEKLIQLPRGKASVYLLNQAKTFIRDNLIQPLQLDTLAGYLHISGRHLSRLFTEGTGQNYVSFVQSERIKSAANLLKYTNDPIKDISEKVGFNSVHYFTKAFSGKMGQPPGEYRTEQSQL